MTVAVDRLELRDRLDEQVEVVASGLRGRADRRRQLDVDAGGVDDPADQVEQRLAGVRAQRRAARRPAARTARAPRRSSRPSPGSSSASPSDATSVGSAPATAASSSSATLRCEPRALAPARAPAELAARAPSSARSRGPIAQRGPVSSVQQLGVGGEVVQQRQRGHHLGDLGQPEQPLEADDLDRDLGARSSASNTSAACALSRVSTPISRHVGRRRRLVRADAPASGSQAELVVVRLVHRRPHRPRRGARLRLERRDLTSDAA